MPSTLLFTSESVTEGHPDKVCDQISDTVLHECLRPDLGARMACEVAVAGNEILVCREITRKRLPDIESLARGVVRDIGYIRPGEGFEAVGCHVTCVMRKQSPEIAENVKADVYTGAIGTGGHGMMFGFAARCPPAPLASSMPCPRCGACAAFATPSRNLRARMWAEIVLPRRHRENDRTPPPTGHEPA